MRCCNIDWLEISAEESWQKYPCDAEFFRSQGFVVHEREYGTRVFGQVFTIEDGEGHDWIEIRRQPPSGASDFKGLTEFSCRLRLVNSQCYVKNCTQKLLEFMVTYDYVFKRIYRIDVCYDFEKFDSGDQPARFARRYIERKFRKINQCKVRVIGDDNWTDFDWESLSWGSPTSMVSTKLYNKSKELDTVSRHKTYIPLAWMNCGLIDNPITRMKRREDGTEYKPEIWRLEFSMKSKADRWLVIEDQGGKRVKKRPIPHTPDMFDSPDKLWQRVQDLAFHYFRFVHAEFNEKPDADGNPVPKLKHLCAEKKLFKWDEGREFMQLEMNVPGAKPNQYDDVFLRRLKNHRDRTFDPMQKKACTVLIDAIEANDTRRYTPHQSWAEAEALKRAWMLKWHDPEMDVLAAIEDIKEKLQNGEIF